MRNIVYFFVFDGFADWEAALALCEIRRPGDYRVRTIGQDRRPVQSMGGLTILPDLSIDEIDVDSAAMIVLPGGTAWERGENASIHAVVRRLHANGAVVAALCGGVLALARAGLLDGRRHTSNYAGYVETYVPVYAGAEHCDPAMLATSDDRVITAGGVGSIEFAREVIRALDLYDARDTIAWYQLFKHAVPPPWFAPAPDSALA